MNFVITLAKERDLDNLLKLYFEIFGNEYTESIGFDRRETLQALQDQQNYHWVVAREGPSSEGELVGACLFEIDRWYKIGKISLMVVREEHQQQGLSSSFVVYGKRVFLEEESGINTLYTTARTVSIAPQVAFLNNGFIPLGIFPNARKIGDYQTLTLMGAFRKGILSKRAKVEKIPLPIIPILQTVNESIKNSLHEDITPFPEQSMVPIGVHKKNLFSEEFEFIEAPHFVQKRFQKVFQHNMDSTFYPFHRPNMLIVGKESKIEIYASYNKREHYCVIIVASEPLPILRENFKKLIWEMKDYGISYVELLVRMSRYDRISFYLNQEFIPSAVYPAMREINGESHDYVLLTRTMEPLDFQGMSIHHVFRPFLQQYTSQWVNRHIDSFEVYYGKD